MDEETRTVTASYKNDVGEPVTITAELSDLAIADLIKFFDSADGVTVYEMGDFAL